MKNAKVALAIILPLLLVAGGGWYYFTGQISDKKPVVELPLVYADNLKYLDDYYHTYENSTPLGDYWMGEYLKSHTWSISKDGINVTISVLGVENVGGGEDVDLNVTFSTKKYVGRLAYILDATKATMESYGAIFTQILTPKEVQCVSNKGWRGANEEVYSIQKSNISFWTNAYIYVERWWTKELSFNFTVLAETKEVVYKMPFHFNITDMPYPLINEPQEQNLTNATYFCYIPVEKRVVMSDHLLKGTAYFFVEYNGTLSMIEEVTPMEYVLLGTVHVNHFYYFTREDMKYTFNNTTPLGRYWKEEFLKMHSWRFDAGNSSVAIYLMYAIGNGTGEDVCFRIIVNASDYMNKIGVSSDALKAVPVNGPSVTAKVTPQKNPLNNGHNYTKITEDFRKYDDLVIYEFKTFNFTFAANASLQIERWNVEELPYAIHLKIGTSYIYYTINLKFNITDEEYPFIDPYAQNFTNATYFCYVPSEGKVVVSNHVVDDTKYYFVESGGVLSRIVEVEE